MLLNILAPLFSQESANYNYFFFKQKTAYEIVSRDWSSDVCSSDLTHEWWVAVSAANAKCSRWPGSSSATVPAACVVGGPSSIVMRALPVWTSTSSTSSWR